MAGVRVLGFNSSHDACAVLVEGGRVAAAVEEERLTRVKHQSGFPARAIRWILEDRGLTAADLSAVAYVWNPARGLLRFAWHVARHLPGSLAYFRSHPGTWRSIVGMRKTLRRDFGFRGPFVFVDHHLCHAASSFYASPFSSAAILTLDGTGEWETTLLARGREGAIERLGAVGYPHSLGKVYEAVTQFLGFRPMSGEGRVMGLAGHGEPRFIDLFRDIVRETRGGYRVDTSFFRYHLGADVKFSPELERVLGPPREEGAEITDRHRDIAASLQLRLEEVALVLARRLRARTGEDDLCVAGGVGFNSVMNGRLVRESGFRRVFITPAANDSGAALGAALAVAFRNLGVRERVALRSAALGPAFGESAVEAALRTAAVPYRRSADAPREAASLLARGLIIGWFHGAMEYGPRALGNRSILADPRRPEMKDILNRRVKRRESFRPFAPAVPLSEAHRFFEGIQESPFMLKVFAVREAARPLIPAVTHVDGTARVQTLTPADNGPFHDLVRAFGDLTGVPVVLNTSFNVNGQPIVCTPGEAIATFAESGLDALVLPPFIVERRTEGDGA